MQHVHNLSEASLTQPSVVTIGVFDGVHKGHEYLIGRLVEAAHAAGRLAVALTFYPHPDVVLRGLQGRYYLTTPEKKAALLGALGVDVVVTQTFDDAFRHIRAADFVDMMLERVRLSSLWVGSDFAMGYQREGDVPFLRAQAAPKGFDVEVIDLIISSENIISSTAIRQAIQTGAVEQAADWLGRAYSVGGEVVHGAHRGRLLGYPTANTAVWSEQVLPANGVYASWVTLGGERFMAATNVGVVPQFGNKSVTVEPYLLDFDRDIYGQTLTVTFEKYLRPEAKFDSVDTLIAQIGRDVGSARDYLSLSRLANQPQR